MSGSTAIQQGWSRTPKPGIQATAETNRSFRLADEELKKMYDACPKYGAGHRYKWTGEDLADFISLSIYTGMRISDVALFQADRMQASGEILIRTTKAGTHVYTWVPESLQDRIKARAKKHGPYIFGAHKPTTLDIITETWRRRLNALWDALWSLESDAYAASVPAYFRPCRFATRRLGA